MTSMTLLSIIIPAYNAAPYIMDCLNSCFSMQEKAGLCNEELEIIVVDDGSTDRTAEILTEAQSLHANLHVLHQKNQGQSVARNLAIEEAHGRYIYMVDSDDQMNPACQLPLADIRNGKYDIIGVQVLYKKENGSINPWSHQMESWPFDQEFPSGADFVNRHNIEGLVYGYLFRRDLFVRHPALRFTPGIYHQDEELIFKIFTLAGPTIYRRGYIYIYYEHAGSSINTKTTERRRKLLHDDLVILRNLTAWRDEHQMQQVMHYKLSYLAMDILRYLIRQQYDVQDCLETIRQLKELKLYPLPWITEIKYLGIKLLTLHPKAVIWWAKHNSWSQKIGI